MSNRMACPFIVVCVSLQNLLKLKIQLGCLKHNAYKDSDATQACLDHRPQPFLRPLPALELWLMRQNAPLHRPKGFPEFEWHLCHDHTDATSCLGEQNFAAPSQQTTVTRTLPSTTSWLVTPQRTSESLNLLIR